MMRSDSVQVKCDRAMRFGRTMIPAGLLLLTFILLSSLGLAAQGDPEVLLKDMRWRNLGPGNFSGRIVDVEAVEGDFRRVFAASASGGVWKSVNAGTTWKPIFDDYGSASIGDIAIFQPNPDIIWVGTGEANNRNSVAWGDGIYKSTDGGETFQHMGLRDTYQIARIITHPRDANIAYVAAIGNLWGYTGERGLFKTTDGGRTWQKLTNGLPDDGKTGATDLVMDSRNPSVLYVAFYQRLRRPWRFDSGGPNGGIYKSTNGGRSWKKLSHGLPDGDTGRIGLSIYRKNPKILMAIIEHGFQPTNDDPDYGDMGKIGTGIYRSEDGGRNWRFVNRYNNRPFYYSQIRINPTDDKKVYVLTTTIRLSGDGGKTFIAGGLNYEGGLDYHGLWLDPNDGDRFYLGKDKGLTLTHDHGDTFVLFDNIPVGQFYAIGVDMRDPYYVYGGTQDNGSWGGPHFGRDARGTLNDSWWKLHWGDGMFVQIDPTDWRKVYTEAENGSFRRYNAETRAAEPSRPSRANVVNYADLAADTEGSDEVSRGTQLPESFRFNWRSPLVMSSHNPDTLYLGGNHLFRTTDEGRHWQIISPDLSTNDPEKVDRETGGLTRDVTGAEEYGTITAFAESPLVPGLLWVGTDDGNLHITRDGGASWTGVRANVPDVPDGIWVSSVEASNHGACTAFVTFDGHRSSEFSTWLFETGDCGQSWQRLSNGLPENHPLYVVRQDPVNPDLLFAGSEFAVHVSLDGGDSWHRLMNNMPTVAVHDLVIHPRDGDLIAGTHGRGLWVLDDITPLQQLTEEIRAAPAHVFQQRPATIWNDQTRGGVRGHLFFAAENPPYIPKRENIVRAKLESGGLVSYYLRDTIEVPVTISISNIQGEIVRTLSVAGEAGVNRALWDLRASPTEEQVQRFKKRLRELLEKTAALSRLTPGQKAATDQANELFAAGAQTDLNRALVILREAFGSMRMFRRSFRGRLQGDLVEPGDYALRLQFGSEIVEGTVSVRDDPASPVTN